MSVLFNKEISKLKNQLLNLGTLVEESMYNSVHSVNTLDQSKAQLVLDTEDRINQLEVEIEEECLKILALHQPVASDLRYIITALKVNQDLEKAGDLAYNNAKRVRRILELGLDALNINLVEMGDLVRSQFRKALDSFLNSQADLAHQVRQKECEVDQLNKTLRAHITEMMQANPSQIPVWMIYNTIVKNLERMADLAENIASQVIYQSEGHIVRHQKED